MSSSSESRHFRGDHLRAQLSFWRFPFLLDYAAIIALGYASRYVQRMHPFEHSVLNRLTDPSITYPHKLHQTVPEHDLYAAAWWTPITIFIVIGLIRLNLAEIHSGLLAFFAGWNLMGIFVGFVKNQVGRLRPDFLDRCQFDLFQQVCTGQPSVVLEGRRSFPSGHSSDALFAAVIVILLFAGKTRSFCFTEHGTSGSHGPWSIVTRYVQSKTLRLAYTLSPLLPGVYIAISRFQDHVHHPTDILAGSAIGTIFALLAYHVFWPSPFVPSNIEFMAEPRALYWAERQTASGEREPLLADERV